MTSDVTLYYAAPIADIQRIFMFSTDAGVDLADDNISILVNQADDFLGDTSAISATGGSAVSNLYVPNASTIAAYDANVVNDVSVLGDALVPDGAFHFASELARRVFGSNQAIDFFTNKTALKISYGNAVETACNTITAVFSSLALSTSYGSLSGGSVNQTVAKSIWDHLKLSVPERFNLSYKMVIAGATSGSYTNVAVGTTGSGTGSHVSFVLGGATVLDNITVYTTGQSYAMGDSITITVPTNGTITCVINSVQAARLNGTLTSATEFPLELDDVFNIQLTIQSNAVQTGSNQVLLSSTGNSHSTTALLKMKLT